MLISRILFFFLKSFFLNPLVINRHNWEFTAFNYYYRISWQWRIPWRFLSRYENAANQTTMAPEYSNYIIVCFLHSHIFIGIGRKYFNLFILFNNSRFNVYMMICCFSIATLMRELNSLLFFVIFQGTQN